MKVSAKAAYACLALLELTLQRHRPEPIRAAEIARRNDIPERFLVQILLQLKGAGYVQSTRGASGGYQLVADPAAVSLWDVIQLVDGPTALGSMYDVARRSANWQALHDVWDDVNRREEELLRQTRFTNLAERVAQSANMFYI